MRSTVVVKELLVHHRHFLLGEVPAATCILVSKRLPTGSSCCCVALRCFHFSPHVCFHSNSIQMNMSQGEGERAVSRCSLPARGSRASSDRWALAAGSSFAAGSHEARPLEDGRPLKARRPAEATGALDDKMSGQLREAYFNLLERRPLRSARPLPLWAARSKRERSAGWARGAARIV